MGLNITNETHIEQDGVRFYGNWAGKPLHLMTVDQLCEIIVQQERRIRAQSEEHLKQLDFLCPTVPGRKKTLTDFTKEYLLPFRRLILKNREGEGYDAR